MKHAVLLLLMLSWPAAAGAQLRSEVYAGGLSRPLELVQDPLQPSVQYVVEQFGRIRVVVNGVVQAQDFLDLTGQVSTTGEQGLLGLAFAPDYAASGRVFVNFTNLSGHTVVARFRRSGSDPLRVDPGSRFDLRWGGGQPFIVQPFANHNGGHLEFGPDGYLYIGMGDGGGGGDPQNNAQDPDTWLGKMLRIDVSVPDGDPEGYDIPPGNPFAFGAALPEIWAFGYRNPWKFTFDRADAGGPGTGALVSGDVGQQAFEEINYEPAGAGGRNYGWRLREGLAPYLPDTPPAFLPLTDPILAYGHDDGRSVTGGYVYRGAALGGGYFGRYFYADFIAGRVWSVALSIDGAGEAAASAPVEHTAELGGSAALGNISAFGVDASGELYLVSFNGSVRRILFDGAAPPPAPGSQFRLSISPPSGGSIFGPGIQCGAAGGSCAIDLPAGIVIGLDVQPSAGFTFAGWTGDAACLDGVVTMTSARTCSATFSSTGGGPTPPPPAPPPPSGTRRLTVVPPSGGTIVGPAISCGTGGSACVVDFPAGIVIGLEAIPDAGSALAGWSSECPAGLVTLTEDRTCAPTFTGGGSPPPPSPPPGGFTRLTIVPASGGTVYGAGIVCGDEGDACVIDLPTGLAIGLEVVPSPGFAFTGWSGAGCGAVVALDEPRTCTASFAPGGSF